MGQCWAVAVPCHFPFALQKYVIKYIDSDVVVIVYDITQGWKFNKVSCWYEEAIKHCPETVIKILVGNKIDMLNEMNKVYLINPLDTAMWESVAA